MLRLTLLFFLAIVGVASAARPATEAERAAVAAGLESPASCATVTMSTVDATWAVAEAVDSESCDYAIVHDKLHVMHSADGAWTEVEALDFPTGCPASIPAAVGTDLGICKTARGYMVCANSTATASHRSFNRPKTCNTLRPKQAFADAVNLAKLHWSGWGKTTAKATGIDRGFRKKDRDTPVTVRASGRIFGCHGDWIYTILRVHSRYGTDVVLQSTDCP